tara:strand:- start:1102 stop:2094 length:993 start_codon:yes stop_codon:yes gene_type:complete
MKNVLITGGTGSFGKKFLETLLNKESVQRIVIYSRDELKQYEMQQTYADKRIRYFLGDVRDLKRMNSAMEGIDTAIHAAALKQVPAAEYNPDETIKTNIIGAQNIIQSAIKNNVKKVVALSTDKAANPINLYGATKLASDKLFSAANNYIGASSIKFSIVRYGNVLGSRGSVVPYFIQLLNNGAKELPITHKEMTRFWITLQQACDFVIDTLDRMQGGEIFVPKIPSVKIVDLANALSEGIKIKEVGIRPGEKLHELLCPFDENIRTFEFADFYTIGSTTNEYKNLDYSKTANNLKGKPVESNFEYNSENNPIYLNIDEIKNLLSENNLL